MIADLKALWQEAFGDSESWLDSFFENCFSPDRHHAVWEDKKPVSALYWFDCALSGHKIAYIYAVATGKNCRGRGLVKSVVTMSAEIQRRLSSVLRDKKYKDVDAVRVIMHPEVLARLRNEDAAILQELEEKYKHDLSFRADPTLHYEEFKLVDPETDAELR